jgi:hypothetical protein
MLISEAEAVPEGECERALGGRGLGRGCVSRLVVLLIPVRSALLGEHREGGEGCGSFQG